MASRFSRYSSIRTRCPTKKKSAKKAVKEEATVEAVAPADSEEAPIKAIEVNEGEQA